MEQARIHRRLVEAGVVLLLEHRGARPRRRCGACWPTPTPVASTPIASDALVSVTCRVPNDALVGELRALGFANVQAIGDAWNPGIIADATFDGRRYAEEFDAPRRRPRRNPVPA